MAQLVLTDLPPAAVSKLEERARSTGTTTAEIAQRLLLRALEEDEVWTRAPTGSPSMSARSTPPISITAPSATTGSIS
jgi:hypothetical protein